jgi:hypothetical protein
VCGCGLGQGVQPLGWAGLGRGLAPPVQASCVQEISAGTANLIIYAHMAPVYGVIALCACRQSRRQSGWSKSVDFGRREPWRL